MVTCVDCGWLQSPGAGCGVCGGAVEEAGDAPAASGHLGAPFELEDALDRLAPSFWSSPSRSALAKTLQPAWLGVWRCDLRFDTAFEAEDGGQPIAGWLDLWADDCQVDVNDPGGRLALGSAEDRRCLYSAVAPPSVDPAAHTPLAGRVWIEHAPDEVRWNLVWVPVWTGAGRVVAATGPVEPLLPDRTRARAAGGCLCVLGLVSLAGSALVAFPGILLWPLLLLTALGSVAGFGLLAVSVLPFGWADNHNSLT